MTIWERPFDHIGARRTARSRAAEATPIQHFRKPRAERVINALMTIATLAIFACIGAMLAWRG